MRIATEATQKLVNLLVDQGVMRDLMIEVFFLFAVRQIAVQDQIADVEEVAIDSQLLDRVAAIQQLALVAVLSLIHI